MTDSAQDRKQGADAAPWWEEAARAAFTRWYDETVGRFLNTPQLGPLREHLHEACGAADAYNRLCAVIGGFAARFGRPFQEAVEAFSRTVAVPESPFKDSKDVYDAFVALLTAKYEAFLSSPEGVDGVARMVDGYLDFKNRLDRAMVPWFTFMAIPTKPEMTDIHRRIHELKRQNRQQQGALDRQAALIDDLQRRLDALEKAGAASSSPESGGRPVRKCRAAPAADRAAR